MARPAIPYPFSRTLALQSISHYHQPGGVHPRPRRIAKDEICIELVTGGRGWVEINQEWREVTPGHLLWHGPGMHTIGRSDFQNPYRCLAIWLDGGTIRGARVPHLTRWEELDEVHRFTAEAVRLWADHDFDSTVLMLHVVSRLYFQIHLYQRGHKQRHLPIELSRVMDVIEHRYGEALNLRELAREAQWSVAHLHERFKEHLGLSPHQALMRRRLRAAREILASTNDPIKSVANQCGFSTAAAFCVQFRKAMQLSPKAYRLRQIYGNVSTLSGATVT